MSEVVPSEVLNASPDQRLSPGMVIGLVNRLPLEGKYPNWVLTDLAPQYQHRFGIQRHSHWLPVLRLIWVYPGLCMAN